jgi:hypothetical protein
MRTSFHLRSEMFPYIYSSTAQSVHDSVPLTRPLYIDYPQDEASYHNGQEYLFGDNLLVAPVVSAGIGAGRVSHQSVYFPRGTWFNTFSNERFAGGTEVLCAATIDEFPLFARGGVPIPMQPYTERMTSTPLSTLRVRVYPGSEGQTGKAQLYEDDGDSNAYKNSASATTQLSYSRKGDDITVTVGATKGQFKGQVANRALKIELPATMRATSATLGAEKLPIAYDDATATNIISVPARPIGKATTIKVTVADADFEMLSQKAQAKRMTALTGRDFAPQSPRDLLKTAMSGDMDGDEMKEALAVVGVGVVRKNLSPTFTNGEVRDIVYAPEGVLDDTPFVSTVSQSRATLKFDGQVLRLPNGLLGNNNIAAAARVKVSGIEPGYGQSGANDGEVSGYPNNSRAEWASGQKENTSIRLDWDTPQTIDRIALFDRINVNDNILKGILTFSDGTTVDVGALPNDGETPFLAKFPAKTVNWVEFKVLAVSSTTEGSGLAEISVFRAKQ